MPRHGGAWALIGSELLRHGFSLLALVIQERSVIIFERTERKKEEIKFLRKFRLFFESR